MRDHVHGADAQHGAVHVETVEHVIHVMILLLPVEQEGAVLRLVQIFRRRHQKARGAAGGVADGLVGLRVHQLDHHADDVARGAELPDPTGRGDLREDVFIDVALRVCFLLLCNQLIDRVHAVHDLREHQRRRDHENRVVHVFRVGAVFIGMQVFDEWEDPLLHDGVHLARREIAEDAPLELCAVDLVPADLDFFGKDALIRQAEHGGFLCLEVVRVVEVADEHQIGHLLHDRQRIHDPARRKDVPQRVDFVFQFSRDHFSASRFHV